MKQDTCNRNSSYYKNTMTDILTWVLYCTIIYLSDILEHHRVHQSN